MSNNRYCLSIGTRTAAIASISAKEMLVENNCIAVKDNKYITACGDSAYEMYEKSPENIDVSFPVEGGVISDVKKMQAILENLYKRLNSGKLIKGSEFLIAVPTDATEVEKRAFCELVLNSKIKPKNISVVEKSIADAVYCGMEPADPTGKFIVNIGADTTTLSIVSTGGIVSEKTLRFGGNKFNEQVISLLRQQEGRLIGAKSAEELKISLADLSENAPERSAKVYARSIETGLPVKTSVDSSLVNSAVKGSISLISEDIMRLLEKVPYELELDIRENGIYLTGGSAYLGGIGSFLSGSTGLAVNTVKDPGNSTIRGLIKIFSDRKYNNMRYFPEEKIYN